MTYVVRTDTEVAEVVEGGRQKLRMRDLVRRDTEVAEAVERTAKVKNERHGEVRSRRSQNTCNTLYGIQVKNGRRGEVRHGSWQRLWRGRQRLRMRDMVRRDMPEVAEDVEASAKVEE